MVNDPALKIDEFTLVFFGLLSIQQKLVDGEPQSVQGLFLNTISPFFIGLEFTSVGE
jgi:hypothetical protein